MSTNVHPVRTDEILKRRGLARASRIGHCPDRRSLFFATIVFAYEITAKKRRGNNHRENQEEPFPPGFLVLVLFHLPCGIVEKVGLAFSGEFFLNPSYHRFTDRRIWHLIELRFPGGTVPGLSVCAWCGNVEGLALQFNANRPDSAPCLLVRLHRAA